ncbi:MAG: tripartite tricarboxylate transporter substrate binding protein [Xanthobacteraceae bacterium]|nr:tripartite tricarboxylate transporter substrate binding protein [Xanthobacteraceae bacterium]
MKQIRTTLAAVAALTLATPAMADDWPSRPVRVISTFAAGGTADILARVVAEHLSTAFKQQFYVEVRAGAGGQIGVKSVIDAPPDGYNFAIANISHLVLHPLTRPEVTYNPLTDLSNIAFVGGSPVVFSVNSEKSGIKTLKQFVDRSKAEKLTYSSSGLGSMGHLVAENFANIAGIKTEHIPYKGASQALNDLVGGHIVWSSQTLTSTAHLMRGNTLQGLAVTTEERLPDWPNLPTFKEQGYPKATASIWFGLSGPAKLPPEIVRKVNEEINKGMRKPEVAARMREDGVVTKAMTPQEYRAFIEEETKIWGPIIKQVGLSEKK